MTNRPLSSHSRPFDPVDVYDRDAAPKRFDLLWSLAGVIFIAAATMIVVDEEWPAPLVSESQAAESTAPDGSLIPPRLNTAALTADFEVAPLSADDVRQLQLKLEALGFAPGKIDGMAGPHTLGALNAYRASRNLEPATRVDYGSAGELLD